MNRTLTEKRVICGKPHICEWCGESVPQGSEAWYWVTVYQGDFFASYFHPECHEAFRDSEWEDGDEWYPYEQQRGKTIDS